MSQSRYVLKPTPADRQAFNSKRQASRAPLHMEAGLTRQRCPCQLRATSPGPSESQSQSQYSTVLRGGLEASVSDSAWPLPVPRLRTGRDKACKGVAKRATTARGGPQNRSIFSSSCSLADFCYPFLISHWLSVYPQCLVPDRRPCGRTGKACFEICSTPGGCDEARGLHYTSRRIVGENLGS
jgi:hypothetical protein